VEINVHRLTVSERGFGDPFDRGDGRPVRVLPLTLDASDEGDHVHHPDDDDHVRNRLKHDVEGPHLLIGLSCEHEDRGNRPNGPYGVRSRFEAPAMTAMNQR
jgi:hypothetical protein